MSVGPEDAPDGPTYRAAIRKWLDLTALDNAPIQGDGNTCRVVFELWLRDLAGTAKPETMRKRRMDAAVFCQTEMGDWTASRLTPFAVKDWLRRMREPRTVTGKLPNGRTCLRTHKWGDGRIASVITSLQAGFNWAVKNRLITKNPLRGLSAPLARSRGRDCIVGMDDHRRIMGACKRNLREFIICLENTGCRPGELLMATAKDWDEDAGALVFYAEQRRQDGEAEHKTSRRGKDRRIFFTGPALELMRARVIAARKGPLWRSARHHRRPWDLHIVTSGFDRLRRKLQMPKLTAYSYRHTFATKYLESGGGIDDLAALMGNTPAVIRKHYAHLLDNVDRLRGLAERFSAARIENPPDVLPFGEVAG